MLRTRANQKSALVQHWIVKNDFYYGMKYMTCPYVYKPGDNEAGVCGNRRYANALPRHTLKCCIFYFHHWGEGAVISLLVQANYSE